MKLPADQPYVKYGVYRVLSDLVLGRIANQTLGL